MGDGADGSGCAWVLEVILQVIVRAGKVPPRRAWLLDVGPLEVFLRPILPGLMWAFTFKQDRRRGFEVEGYSTTARNVKTALMKPILTFASVSLKKIETDLLGSWWP